MDDRTYRLIIAILAVTVAVTLLAGLAAFEIPAAFWTIPGGIITLLTVIASRKNRANGSNDNDIPPPPEGPPEMSDALLEAERAKIREYLDSTKPRRPK